MSDLKEKYKKFTFDQLLRECISLEAQNRTLLMRLVAVKTIVTSCNPICAEKLRDVI